MRLRDLLLAPILGLSLLASASAAEYEKVDPPQPTSVGEGKVEVVELFWYGCPHCHQFEPYLAKWLANKPANVEFVRMPAIFSNPQWQLHATAFYTAEALGIAEKFHTPFFNALHVDQRPMNTPELIGAFFTTLGVSQADFDKAFNSFAVKAKVSRAADLSRRYGISGVPSLVVNGKYRTDGPMAKTYDNLVAVLDTLVKKESGKK